MSESNVPPPPPPGASPNDPLGLNDTYDTAPPSAPPPPPDKAMLNPTPTPPPAPAQPIGYEGPPTGYPGPYAGPPPDKDSKTMGMLAHLLSIFVGFLGPLVIWMAKKDSSPFVDDQGKESLNFQLVALIGYVIGFATSFLCIGFLILPAVWLLSVIFAIMGTIQASNGVAYRYPINIRFIK